MSYGFRIFGVKLTPYRRLQPTFKFDNPQFGPDGALGLFKESLPRP